MIDVRTNKHIVAFPTKVAAASGSPHQYNVKLDADRDNGTLLVRSAAWDSFDCYAENTSATITFAGLIQNQAANGNWYIEVTAATTALFVYNSPVSEYGEKIFQDEDLFYNKAGDVVRAYALSVGDIIEVSALAFNGTPAKNTAVTYVAGKYKI